MVILSKIKNIRCGNNHVIIELENGDAFVSGLNEYGQLGLNDTTNRNVFVKLDIPPVDSISASGNHSVALTRETKNVYVFGYYWESQNNQYHSYGQRNKITQRNKPTKVDSSSFNEETPKKIQAANQSTFVLTEQGNIFSMGYNGHGELGIGSNNSQTTFSMINKEFFQNEKVIDICAGNAHCIATTESGKLFSWGFGDYGQLGIDSTSSQSKPVEIDLSFLNGQFIQQVCTYCNWSMILTKEGKVYTCGYGNEGSLGIGDTSNKSKFTQIPQESFNNEKIVELCESSYSYHAFVISEKGNIFVWGRNNQRQLSLNCTTQRNEPTAMNLKLFLKNNVKVEKFFVGSFDRGVSFLVTNTGKLYGCGNNEFGQLGLHHNDQNVSKFTKIKSELFRGYNMHYEASIDNVDVVKQLLKSGYKVNDKDRSGKNPLDYAIENKCGNTIKAFVEYFISEERIEKRKRELRINNANKFDFKIGNKDELLRILKKGNLLNEEAMKVVLIEVQQEEFEMNMEAKLKEFKESSSQNVFNNIHSMNVLFAQLLMDDSMKNKKNEYPIQSDEQDKVVRCTQEELGRSLIKDSKNEFIEKSTKKLNLYLKQMNTLDTMIFSHKRNLLLLEEEDTEEIETEKKKMNDLHEQIKRKKEMFTILFDKVHGVAKTEKVTQPETKKLEGLGEKFKTLKKQFTPLE